MRSSRYFTDCRDAPSRLEPNEVRPPSPGQRTSSPATTSRASRPHGHPMSGGFFPGGLEPPGATCRTEQSRIHGVLNREEPAERNVAYVQLLPSVRLIFLVTRLWRISLRRRGPAGSLKVYRGVGREIPVKTTKEKTLSVHVVRERLWIAALLASVPLVALVLYLVGRRS